MKLKEVYEENNRLIKYLNDKLSQEVTNHYKNKLNKAIRRKESMKVNAKNWGISLD